MLRGSWGDVALATGIQVAALTAICAGYGGYLRAPLGWALRGLLLAAGLVAAFLHDLPDPARLGLAGAALALTALLSPMLARRP
jgi:hypothetical protein